MHPNPAFRGAATRRNIAFARQRGFGTLAVNGTEGPLLSHVPFLLSEDGATADLHLVRSNPIARLGEVGAAIAVNGPDGYISPDWYCLDDQVPTWNYVAVHLRGRLTPLDPRDLRDVLDRQSDAYEHGLAPKPPWSTDKMTPEVLTRMMRQILPFRLLIFEIDGTWKLNQNKPEVARRAAADRVGDGQGHELAALQAMMRDPD